MEKLNENDQTPKWSIEAKAAFTEFRKRRRTLPSPPYINHEKSIPIPKKQRGNIFGNSINNANGRSIANEFNAINDEANVENSTFSEHFMSVDLDLDSELDRTEVLCDDAEKNIALVREMINNKNDPYVILEKLTDGLSEYYKNSREALQKINSDNATRINRLNGQIVSLENDLYKKIDEVQENSDEKIKAIEISQKCTKESNTLWISFVDPGEVEKLRLKNRPDLIRETKNILNRMNIWTNSSNRMILDVNVQKVTVKIDGEYKNELILGAKFMNSYIVRDLKRLIMEYVKTQYLNKNYDSVRYTVRDNWSQEIWKILRVCYDLVNFKLIDKAQVTDTGVLVAYDKRNDKNNSQAKDDTIRVLVRNEKDLNALRVNINDVACNISTFQFYDSNYFKMNNCGRKSHKDKFASSMPMKQLSAVHEEPVNPTSSNTPSC
ncbi:unnamed protein product [Chironomus riparius]|uniref:Uncharacterized protein n=1 Tax=Chironomus riparius TaxID=315576 RepID=A0A9N9WMN7_9DIPT|nr:unnamed protein product [Chironomus riparius]